MDNLLDILESILLQNDKVNLSTEELQLSLSTVNDIIRLSNSIKSSILNTISDRYRKELLENDIYYNDIYMSKLIDNSNHVNAFKSSNKKQISPLIEKIGGVPTLKRGEKWPMVNGKYLTFVAQFKYPNKQNDILYRIFADLDDKMSNYYISMPLVIRETNNYLKNIKLSFPDVVLIKEYIIQEWVLCKELKSFDSILSIYTEELYCDEKIKGCECEHIFEEVYDSIINEKSEIDSSEINSLEIKSSEIDSSEIKQGIKIFENSLNLNNCKKKIFQIPADLFSFSGGFSDDDGIYYFYEDEHMQYLCA